MKELLTRVFESDLDSKPVLYSELTPGSDPPAFRKRRNIIQMERIRFHGPDEALSKFLGRLGSIHWPP